MSRILWCENITKSYNEFEQVLKGISIEFSEKTFSALIGQSGSGKSTFFNIASGLLKPDRGKVFIDPELSN